MSILYYIILYYIIQYCAMLIEGVRMHINTQMQITIQKTAM